MSRPQIRSSQMITTFGPGAMLDLPDHSIIVAGLDDWKYDYRADLGHVREVVKEQRLSAKLAQILPEVEGMCELRTPPISGETIFQKGKSTAGVFGYIFPHWFIVQNVKREKYPRRRLVMEGDLTGGKFKENGRRHPVVAVRFVRACRKGHVGDIQWRRYVHKDQTNYNQMNCMQALWMEERGTSGDLSNVWIVCDCGAQRSMGEAADFGTLGQCNGSRPWLDDIEGCDDVNRLLLRTASNAYFPVILSVISIPDSRRQTEVAVEDLWKFLRNIKSENDLQQLKILIPEIGERLSGISDADVVSTIKSFHTGSHLEVGRSPKQTEFDALIDTSEEAENDEPDRDFFVCKLDEKAWSDPKFDGLIEKIVLVHRLREVSALVGFTRFEAETTDLGGELDMNVKRAQIARKPKWLPVTENRGEGLFIQFNSAAIQEWTQKDAVQKRGEELLHSFDSWREESPSANHIAMPPMPYLMLHSLSHLLITAVSLECGYPPSSLRERIYAFGRNAEDGQYGILLFTASFGSEGTLGGLVNGTYDMKRHLSRALELGRLCSNDPVCSSNVASGRSDRMAGHACHGCLYVAETSCEHFNQYLDRTLVVPTLGRKGSEFFKI